MATSHPSQSRWVVVRGLLRVGRLLYSVTGEKVPRHHGRTGCHRNAVEEVPARDLAVHSEFPVSWILHDLLRCLTAYCRVHIVGSIFLPEAVRRKSVRTWWSQR